MSTAAKKAAVGKPATETPIEGPEAEKAATPPPARAPRTKARPKLDLAEEQRTANLIAVLALGPDAWSDLFAAGVDRDEGPANIAQQVVDRLGIGSES